ncbi:TRAP transporter large permease subunit [Chloroflexota bacterium]
MEWWQFSIIIALALIALLASGMPIGFSLGFLALGLIIATRGPDGLFLIASTAFQVSTMITLTCLPMFVLMAEVILFSGISVQMFDTVAKWLNRLPGGLFQATIAASTAFAAVTGSSVANCVTIATIAVPEMVRYNYDKKLAAACVGAGGALGILIPPSGVMILYSIVTEVSLGRLFMGGILPGVLLAGCFMIYVGVRALKNPKLAPALPDVTMKDRFDSLFRGGTWATLLLGASVLGSIYMGVATPTEAAGVGAFLSLLIALGYRKLNKSNLSGALLRTAQTTCMVLWIVIGAMAFGYILTYLRIPEQLTIVIANLSATPLTVIFGMQVLLLILGCFLDPASIILITVPILAPLVASLGFDLVWFGVIFTINMEMSYITPPFGLNLFVLKGVMPPDVSMRDIIAGCAPFVIIDAAILALCIFFPQIILFIPSTMG